MSTIMTPDRLSQAPIISASTVRVEMAEPVIVARAAPTVRSNGTHRMPKVFRLPEGELCVCFAVGTDTYRDHGQTSPMFVSRDEGVTWEQRWPWPHSTLGGMNPVITPVHGGEFWSLPADTGLRLDPERLPKPVGQLGIYVGFSLYRLEECPDDVVRWFTTLRGVRWSPATKQWSEEPVQWDHRGQLVWCNHDVPNRVPGIWTQRVYCEGPVVRLGGELLHADYWTMYETGGTVPAAWECHLMASGDNGRSWTRRSRMAVTTAGDSPCEPVIELNDRGELVGVMRREAGDWRDQSQRNPSMYLVHSADGGRSWSERRHLFGFGVFPRLLQLDNGVLVLAFGRPGNWLSFSLDGGRSWTEPRGVGDERQGCGYTSLVALGRDSFLLAYSDNDLPDAQGRPCKTILTRRVAVRPA
jgi:hypothetical protein